MFNVVIEVPIRFTIFVDDVETNRQAIEKAVDIIDESIDYVQGYSIEDYEAGIFKVISVDRSAEDE